MNAFRQAVAWVIEREGGGTVTDDPDDPGGLTRWGISKRAFPHTDIRNLSREEAEDIYLRKYWLVCKCDAFPPPVAVALFDSAVNQGPGKAVRLLQRALGVEDDGAIGDDTLSAAMRAVPGELLVQYLSRRAVDYARLDPKFHRGWFVRLFELQRFAWSLA